MGARPLFLTRNSLSHAGSRVVLMNGVWSVDLEWPGIATGAKSISVVNRVQVLSPALGPISRPARSMSSNPRVLVIGYASKLEVSCRYRVRES